MKLLFFLLLSALVGTACQRTALPPIPVDYQEREAPELGQARQDDAGQRDGVAHAENEDAARQVLHRAIELADDRRGEELFRLLSSETRLLLDRYHPEGGEKLLESGEVHDEDERYLLDVAAWLFDSAGVEDLAPASPDVAAARGSRRVEFALRDSDRTIVVVREGDEWRVHRTTIHRDFLEPAR